MDEIVINTATNSFINKSEFKCSGYGLYDLLKDKGTAVGLEIGCDIGDTSYFLLSKLNNLSLYSIDPYIDYIDWNGIIFLQENKCIKMCWQEWDNFQTVLI